MFELISGGDEKRSVSQAVPTIFRPVRDVHGERLYAGGVRVAVRTCDRGM